MDFLLRFVVHVYSRHYNLFTATVGYVYAKRQRTDLPSQPESTPRNTVTKLPVPVNQYAESNSAGIPTDLFIPAQPLGSPPASQPTAQPSPVATPVPPSRRIRRTPTTASVSSSHHIRLLLAESSGAKASGAMEVVVYTLKFQEFAESVMSSPSLKIPTTQRMKEEDTRRHGMSRCLIRTKLQLQEQQSSSTLFPIVVRENGQDGSHLPLSFVSFLPFISRRRDDPAVVFAAYDDERHYVAASTAIYVVQEEEPQLCSSSINTSFTTDSIWDITTRCWMQEAEYRPSIHEIEKNLLHYSPPTANFKKAEYSSSPSDSFGHESKQTGPLNGVSVRCFMLFCLRSTLMHFVL
ncbi:hypothetical protein C8R42DRAFT_640946 [Lentinula raphanica]|nr:hypothetical protein C8R42DRAFT_640946 [Lentinula raphanica]